MPAAKSAVVSPALCSKCGAYLGPAGGDAAISCRQCIDHHYDRAFAAGIYEQGLAVTIVRLKTDPHLFKRSKDLICSAYERTSLQNFDLIIPVPLSRKRFHERGSNQAEILAAYLSKRSGIPLAKNALVRSTHTAIHRAAMDKKAREMTVKNSFEIARVEGLVGAHLLLVDDVFTSGATVSACSKLLKDNGASRIDVLTLARAV